MPLLTSYLMLLTQAQTLFQTSREGFVQPIKHCWLPGLFGVLRFSSVIYPSFLTLSNQVHHIGSCIWIVTVFIFVMQTLLMVTSYFLPTDKDITQNQHKNLARPREEHSIQRLLFSWHHLLLFILWSMLILLFPFYWPKHLQSSRVVRMHSPFHT